MSFAASPRYVDSCEEEMIVLMAQLELIDTEKERGKGKTPLYKLADARAAFSSYIDEIKARLQCLSDFKLARSMADAVDADSHAIAALRLAEEHDHENYLAAVEINAQINGGAVPARPVQPQGQRTSKAHFMDYLESEEADVCEETGSKPLGTSISRQANALNVLSEMSSRCIACQDDFRSVDITQLQCNHQYCRVCLKAFIMRGVVDHDLALIPPRCCGAPVPNEMLEDVLATDELQDFHEAQVEKTTRKKVYCCEPSCGKFIVPDNIKGDTATCRRCQTRTCALCSNASHEDDCPADMDLQATLNLGQENQWQRCFSCRAVVSLEQGCNHMTCRCGAQFCYMCGAEWTVPKSCDCLLWQEENLVRRAQDVVDREAHINLNPVEHRRRVAEVQFDLRDNDDCDHVGHGNFKYIVGNGGRSFQCELCNMRHRKFIFRCRQCNLDVCAECRRHRV